MPRPSSARPRTAPAARARALGLALVLCAPTGAARAAPAHQVDGPDADLRLRIEDEGVRLDLALNLACVDALLDGPRARADALAPDEAEALGARLSALVAERCTVEIDGIAVRPLARGLALVPAPEHLVPLFPRFGERALARVELALWAPAKAPPERVRLAWGLFPPGASAEGAPPIEPIELGEIGAAVRAEGREIDVVLRSDAPEWTWTRGGSAPAGLLPVPEPGARPRALRPLALALLALAALALGAAFLPRAPAALRRRAAAVAALACAAAAAARGLPAEPEPSRAALLAIFRPLHANVYRAFDYEDESAVYDALAESVEGELLEELYVEIHRSLLDEAAGGARSRVDRVELLAAEPRPLGRDARGRAGFEVDARWRVEGTVRHFGHAHARADEHRALYVVRATERGWRIVASQPLEERRISAAPLGPALPAAGEGER